MLQSFRWLLKGVGDDTSMPGCGTAVDTPTRTTGPSGCPRCGEKMRVERTFDHFVLLDTLALVEWGRFIRRVTRSWTVWWR